MEINYDIIIKYLVKKNVNSDNNIKQKNKSNTFITQKSIFNYSVNFPEKFKELFTDKFYRYGITIHDHENTNISFWSSILTLIDKNFLIPYNNDELSLINQFKNQLIDKYAKSKLSTIFKSFDKNDLRERLKLDPDIYILQYIVDILDINFIIFDFETTNIYSVYHKDIMNPWKQTLLLSKFKNYWEPIMMDKNKNDTQKLFDYNNNVIKKIIQTNNLIEYFEKEKIEKDFMFIDNINDLLLIEKKKLKIQEIPQNTKKELIEEFDDSESSVRTDDENNIFVKKDELEKISKLNKSKINKMKVQELWDIIGKLNIVIEKKNPTKSVLMDSILSKIGTS
jgi:hypothetical protein